MCLVPGVRWGVTLLAPAGPGRQYLGGRVVRQLRRAGDDDVSPFPWLLPTQEGQLLSHPFVPK
jgi:hypothetical protein